MLKTLLQNRYLISQLSKREILSKYQGSVFGLLWTLITPLAMLLVFSFVFGQVFQTKWPGNNDMGQVGFSTNLFIGLSVFWYFTEVISRAPTLFSSVPNYVKKVVFPLETLPLVSLISSLFQFMIYLVLIVLAATLILGTFSLYLFLIPLIVLLTFPLLIGLSLVIGSISVYFRDLQAVVGVLMTLLMFLSPIFYPVEALPQNVQWLFQINPLTLIIETLRELILQQTQPNWVALAIYLLTGLLLLAAGVKTFNTLKRGFADVI